MHANALLSKGFTLVEVLVALIITALALSALIRTSSSVSTHAAQAKTRLLAQWSVENTLALLWSGQGGELSLGKRDMPCPQLQFAFRCDIEVNNTPNPFVVRVTVNARLEKEDYSYAQITAFLPLRHPLLGWLDMKDAVESDGRRDKWLIKRSNTG